MRAFFIRFLLLYCLSALASAETLNLTNGWNLAGNSVNTPLVVASTFGDASTVSTVWKWIPVSGKWAFYTPSLADGGAAYALSNGYDYLTTINGGEGFWVNARTAFTAILPAGTPTSSNDFADQFIPPNKLTSGWSLIATGDNPTTIQFTNTISLTPPVAPIVVATSLVSLWAWNSNSSSWYFYAPSMENDGSLSPYLASKGYLDFKLNGKTLGSTTGFWVNKAGLISSLPPSPSPGLTPQSIGAISFSPTTLAVGGTMTVSAGATSKLAVNFKSTTPSICTVSGYIITAISAGTCSIAANQSGNTSYSPAPELTQYITVMPAVSVSPNNLNFTTLGIGTSALGSWNVTVTNNGPTTLVISAITSSNSDFAVAQNNCNNIATGASCVISLSFGPTAIGARSGTLSILSNDTDSPHTVTLSGTGVKGSQIISALSLSPGTLVYLGTSTLSATSTSGNAVTFSSKSPDICTVIGNTVSDVTIGTCIIAANQAGDANHIMAAELLQSITVSNLNQTIGVISFNPTTLAVGGTTTVSAIATSTLPVTFTSMNLDVCTVSGNIVTGITTGTCTIAANQAGNSNYSAAAQATQTITLTQLPVTVHLGKGWNLIGSGGKLAWTANSVFSDKNKIITVWKWLGNLSMWEFYTPSMSPAELQNYADNKGYKVLDSIAGQDGIWVNAVEAQDINLVFGGAYTAVDHRATLLKNWNLVSVGEALTPVRFNNYLTVYTGPTPPEIGSASTTTAIQSNLTTLWAWNNATAGWLFYSPALQLDLSLATYIDSKGYLDFTKENKLLGPGVGFWVNKP